MHASACMNFVRSLAKNCHKWTDRSSTWWV